MPTKEKLLKSSKRIKLFFTILFVVSLIIVTVLAFLAVFDKEKNFDAYLGKYLYYTKDLYILLLFVFGWVCFICLALWVASLISVKFKTHIYNGHEINVYIGVNSVYLLLDGVVVDKYTGLSFHAITLECDLSYEKVLLRVGVFSSNYTLRVGNNVLH